MKYIHTNFSCGFWHKILIFSTMCIQLLLFLSPLNKSYLFPLLFSIYLNYLNGAGNPEPAISLWSQTTPIALIFYIKKISSKLGSIFSFFSFSIYCDSHFHFCVFLASISLPAEPFLLSLPLPPSLSLLSESWYHDCPMSSPQLTLRHD